MPLSIQEFYELTNIQVRYNTSLSIISVDTEGSILETFKYEGQAARNEMIKILTRYGRFVQTRFLTTSISEIMERKTIPDSLAMYYITEDTVLDGTYVEESKTILLYACRNYTTAKKEVKEDIEILAKNQNGLASIIGNPTVLTEEMLLKAYAKVKGELDAAVD